MDSILELISTYSGEVVVAQLVERSLLTSEVRGSTPVIGKILLNICLLSTVLKRRKINKKRLEMAHFLKISTYSRP